MEEKTQSQAFLGTEPVGKLLFRLALPAIAAQLINVLYNIVDRVYLGHIPGVGGLALTGVGVCSPIILIISAFAALVSMGGAPLASIELGKQNQDGAKRIMGSCFALQVVLSLVLTAASSGVNRCCGYLAPAKTPCPTPPSTSTSTPWAPFSSSLPWA